MSHIKYYGYRVSQRQDASAPAFFVFYGLASEVTKWAGLKRIAEVPAGTQRLLRKARQNAIRRFFAASPVNTIPNNLLIAFNPTIATFAAAPCQQNGAAIDVSNRLGERMQLGSIEFDYEETTPEHQRPALVVDGQHRLYGAKDFENGNIPLLIVAMLDAQPVEQAFQFIVINNKAVRVHAESVKSIIADVDTEELALTDRLQRSGVKYGQAVPELMAVNNQQDSPFYNLLDWSHNREGRKLVPITAIETCLTQIQKGFDKLLGDNDEDSSIQIFLVVWTVIKNQFPGFWNETNQFLNKANVVALNELVTERIKGLWSMDLCDPLDDDSLRLRVAKIFENVPPDFWTTPWKITVQDNANVRRLIIGDVVKIIENIKMGDSWSADLKLIDPPNQPNLL
jgi:DGQHR domain-containing protein